MVFSREKKIDLPFSDMIDFPYLKNRTEQDFIHHCVEIVDNQGLPFLLMPLELARKKKLPRRIFLSVLKDNKKRALIVKQRSLDNKKIEKKESELWTLSSIGNVLAGESAEGAVLRKIQNDFNLDTQMNLPIEELHTLPFMEKDTMLSASIFLAGPCKLDDMIPNPETILDAMLLTKDELEGLSTQHPEMFHSLLFWALRSGWIF